MVSFVHAATYGFEVVLYQRVAYCKHTVFLFDNEFGAEVVFGCDVALDVVEHFLVGVAKGLDTEAFCHALA